VNRDDFKSLCQVRKKEAKILLKQGMYTGAYYLTGIAVECAFKACIAKLVKKYDFPDKNRATTAWTHDLSKLLSISGLEPAFIAARNTNAALDVNWATVKDWTVEARYQTARTRQEAHDLFNAAFSSPAGVVTWIKKLW